jgi:hypothetical protein
MPRIRHVALMAVDTGSDDSGPDPVSKDIEPMQSGGGRSPVAPPPVPVQGAGPHFELDAAGVIHFAPPEALDRDGNNVALLRSLHPPLRDLARSLVQAFARSNAH